MPRGNHLCPLVGSAPRPSRLARRTPLCRCGPGQGRHGAIPGHHWRHCACGEPRRFQARRVAHHRPCHGRDVHGQDHQVERPQVCCFEPGKKLPDQSITVVHRADGSGTTFNWTDYLTAVSKEWADTVGKGAAVKWPAASSVGGKGNEGVAANVNRVKGAIGYVEYAYVKKNNMNFLQLQNADGKYVSPDDTTFAAAAAGADWFSVPGMGISMVNAKGATSWPVSTASFILMYKDPSDKNLSKEAIKFFDWAFKNGKGMAAELDYVPLPDALTKQIRERVWTQIKN
ncbi:hypothetical protein GHT06_007206 [Daphnia sinensis]|uniref:PBP domain-containing protein n=1 Tax=Daphnia sinensis TaxID=1820382 RepID=A0AAD5KD40_9CRUS|nr:hypothetical protein GHT06_006662 [Daphnia sinensis]KAI9549332.1 hypothetical protein GHT06_006631 [Daphnia sinensis]KAI9549406.1 hypothetical protein GHT06_007206 [Daphnia sinensis]